jgi:hypothetical protein
MTWGWKVDRTLEAKEDPHHQVLYVTLPQGQVSFHSANRLQGPEYPAEFDGAHASAERILAYCDAVASSEPTRQAEPLPKPQITGVIVCGKGSKPSRYEEELRRGKGRLAL